MCFFKLDFKECGFIAPDGMNEILLNPFSSGGFCVEVKFHKLGIKKDAAGNFDKGERAVTLLVS